MPKKVKPKPSSREARLELRLTRGDYKLLADEAKKRGMGLSTFVRMVALEAVRK